MGLMLLVLAGCAQQAGRYQLISLPPATVWRLDTLTGEMEACGFEAGKPLCHSFPAPAQQPRK